MGVMKRIMGDKPRFKNKGARELMAFTLALDPTMKDMLGRMFKMGAHNIRPDYMLVCREDGSVEQLPDPCAWMGRINDHVGVMLLRSRDGEWWLNGY